MQVLGNPERFTEIQQERAVGCYAVSVLVVK